MAELKDKAEMHVEDDIVDVLDLSANIAKSDKIVPHDLQEELRVAVAPLESVPERLKDWHPGSGKKVLDLVHPSLFPLVYGRSRGLADDTVGLEDCMKWTGKGEIIPVSDDLKAWHQNNVYGSYGGNFASVTASFSKKFQWLPCNAVFADDQSVKIKSYINNLHPIHHAKLYEVLEKLLAKAVPLWNRALSGLDPAKKARIDPEVAAYDFPDGQWSDREPESDDPDEEEDEDAYMEFRQAWIEAHRVVEQPDPDEYKRRESGTPFDLGEMCRMQGFQTIVKLANIHLTPERPTYEGGSWHVEGMLNEHICATAIYYYDNENITDSHLYFRQKCETRTLNYKQWEQNDSESVEVIYGVDDHGAAIQDVGRILTREGRMLAFPNVLQHRVGSFELVNKTKPGHRKIVAFFLVDPYIRTLSTANVPPQQKDWWAEVIASDDNKVSQLPTEVFQHVVDDVEDFPISLEDAKRIREELMSERSVYVDTVNREL